MSSAGEPVVLGLALAYGGLAQLLAGMWEFRTGNTFGATAFSSYGAFWLSFWAFGQFYEKHVPKADAGHAVGLYLIAWGIFTAYMFVASLRTTAAVALVFLLLAVTFFVARHRQRGRSLRHREGRWLDRSGDRARRVVRLVRGGDQRDLRAHGASGQARWGDRDPDEHRTGARRRTWRRKAKTLEQQPRGAARPGDVRAAGGLREQAVVSDPRSTRRPTDYEAFWAEQAEALALGHRSGTRCSTGRDPPFAKWFVGGKLNVSYNCVDRHVEAGNGDRVAFHWRGEEGEELDVTYADLHRDVQQFANALKDLGIEQGRRRRDLSCR